MNTTAHWPDEMEAYEAEAHKVLRLNAAVLAVGGKKTKTLTSQKDTKQIRNGPQIIIIKKYTHTQTDNNWEGEGRKRNSLYFLPTCVWQSVSD